MQRAHYTVVKRNGRWGIRACGAPFFECESYREALEVSRAAASVLSTGEAKDETERAQGHASDRAGNNPRGAGRR